MTYHAPKNKLESISHYHGKLAQSQHPKVFVKNISLPRNTPTKCLTPEPKQIAQQTLLANRIIFQRELEPHVLTMSASIVLNVSTAEVFMATKKPHKKLSSEISPKWHHHPKMKETTKPETHSIPPIQRHLRYNIPIQHIAHDAENSQTVPRPFNSWPKTHKNSFRCNGVHPTPKMVIMYSSRTIERQNHQYHHGIDTPTSDTTSDCDSTGSCYFCSLPSYTLSHR